MDTMNKNKSKNGYGRKSWPELSKGAYKGNLPPFIHYIATPNTHGRKTQCTTTEGLLQVLPLLPGKVVPIYREEVTKILQQMIAGGSTSAIESQPEESEQPEEQAVASVNPSQPTHDLVVYAQQPGDKTDQYGNLVVRLDEFGLNGEIRFARTDKGVLFSKMDVVQVTTGKDSNQSGNILNNLITLIM